MSLERFTSIHAGATALLFGKGPSLDTFLADAEVGLVSLAGETALVVGLLNDTVAYRDSIIDAVLRAVGGPCEMHVYAFANDSIAPWVHTYRAGDVLFQPARTLRDLSMHAPAPECTRVEYHDSGGDIHRLALPLADRASRALVAGHGTCDSAVQILAIMGCTRLIAVGIDGGGGRSALPWLTAMRSDHEADYRSIRRDFERMLLRLRLPTEFYGSGRRLVADPVATLVRCTGAVLCGGVHYEPGDEIPAEHGPAALQVGRAVIEPVPA